MNDKAHHIKSALSAVKWVSKRSRIKIVKGAIQKAKCSGGDSNITLLDLRATVVDNQLPLTAEILYQKRIRTTIPRRVQNTGPASATIVE